MALRSEMGVNSHGPTKLPLPTNSVKDALLSEDAIVLAPTTVTQSLIYGVIYPI